MGHIFSVHIDDIYLQGSSYEEYVGNVIDTTISFDNLGLTIHPEKSSFIPKQVITHLGFILNSKEMTVRLTPEKAGNVASFCRSILEAQSCTIREIARAVGLMVLSFPGVTYGPLRYRDLENDKITALKAHKWDYEKSVVLSEQAKSDLHWWVANIYTSFGAISHEKPSLVLHTDASETGWGAVHDDSHTGGQWTCNESEAHINYLELIAAYFGLKSFFKKCSSVHIRLIIDNTTAVYTLNNMGTSRSYLCNSVVKKIWSCAIKREVWLSSVYIPGKLKEEADAMSREEQIMSEWMLSKDIFAAAMKKLDITPNIDLFASPINCQLIPYVSYRLDPESCAIVAFSLDWSQYEFNAFLPFSVILMMLQKLEMDGATGVRVVPNWPTQPWYPKLMRMVVKPPVMARHSRTLLHLPSFPEEVHPLHKKLDLMICLVSGKT